MFLSDFADDHKANRLFISLLCTYLYHWNNSSLSKPDANDDAFADTMLTEKVRTELRYFNEDYFNIYFEADSEDREKLHLEALGEALNHADIKHLLIEKLLEDSMSLKDVDSDSLLELLSGMPEGIIWSVREVTRSDCYPYRDQGRLPNREIAHRIIFELCDLLCFLTSEGELERAFLTGVCQALEVDSRHVDHCKALLQSIYDEQGRVRAALATLSSSDADKLANANAVTIAE